MRKVIAIGLALALVISVSAMAQQGQRGGGGNCDMSGPHGRMGGHGMGMGMKGDGLGVNRILMAGDEINLTDEQEQRLEQLMDEFQLERIDKQAEIKKARLALRAMMRDEAPESDVMRGIDNVSQLQASMHKMKYQHHQQVKSVLTQEQIDKLKELRKTRRAEMRERGAQGRRMQRHGR
jgi:Spy/CpxP family protein refolding chaperone